MDFSINKKKENKVINSSEEKDFDPFFGNVKVEEQNFENLVIREDDIVQAEENINPFSDEFYNKVQENNKILPSETATVFDKSIVKSNITQLNTKLRFGVAQDTLPKSQSSVTSEMLAEAQSASSIFQQMANSAEQTVTNTQAIDIAESLPHSVIDQVVPGAIKSEMLREAAMSSSVFQDLHKQEQDKQPSKVAPDFVVESNVEKWSTIAKTDDRINPNAMHKHMAETENAIHEQMSHGEASVDFFDTRKPEKLNNYYEHSISAALSHLNTKTGNQFRDSVKGMSNEKEMNDVAFANSKSFMEDKQKKELEFNELYNPEAVPMVEKKQKFERVDFNIRDKANNNRLGMETIANTEASITEKKNVKLNPISAEEKLEWLNAYKDYNKEREIYQGASITENMESRLASRLENNFEKNYYKMMEKSIDKDYLFDKKDVKPAFEHNKGIKTSVSDLEKDKTQNSFRDYKSNELGETWKHELKDKSINSLTTQRPDDPFKEAKPKNKINLNNAKQPTKFKDYSPELQAIIMRADQKMQQEYGTKPLDVQFGEESTGFQTGKAKSMQEIWAETSQKYQATQNTEKNNSQDVGGSAEMQAIKSVQPATEMSEDKKRVLGALQQIRGNTPGQVEDKKKKQIEKSQGIEM